MNAGYVPLDALWLVFQVHQVGGGNGVVDPRVGVDAGNVLAAGEFFHQLAVAGHLNHINDLKRLIRNAALLQKVENWALRPVGHRAQRIEYEGPFSNFRLQAISRTEVGLLGEHNQGLGCGAVGCVRRGRRSFRLGWQSERTSKAKPGQTRAL